MWLCGVKFFSIYLRLLGLSCGAHNRFVEALLIFYSLLIAFHEAHQSVPILRVIGTLFVTKGLLPLIDITLRFSYRAVHFLLVLQAVIWRRSEGRIQQLLDDIDDEIQRHLYQPHRPNAGRKLFGLRFCYMLFEFCIFVIYSLFLWYFKIGGFVTNFGFVFMTQAIRARYLQYIFLVDEIEDKLRSLERAIENSLLATSADEDRDSNTPRRSRSAPASNIASDSAAQRPPMRIYLRRRIQAMKRVYWKITLITRNMTQLFGVSIVLMDFLIVCDFTEVFYALALTLESDAYSWLTIISGMLHVVPAVVKITSVGLACESCSRRSAKLLSLLSLAPYKGWQYENSTIDDLRFQIMQNPIEFHASGFYKLNLQTLTAMVVLVSDFVLILMQFARFTHEL